MKIANIDIERLHIFLTNWGISIKYNMGWPSNVTWNIQRKYFVKMTKTNLLYATHWQNVTKRALLLSKLQHHKNGTPQKWHVTKTTSHKMDISKLTLLVFQSNTNPLLTELTPKVRQKVEKLNFNISSTWVWLIQQT